MYVVVGRKSWEEGAPVQDPGDRRTRDREDLHHQALCPPVLLSTLQSHCILLNHKQSTISFILFTVFLRWLLEIRKLRFGICCSVPGTILTVWPWVSYYLLSLTFALRLEWILLWRSWTGMQTQLFDFSYGTLQVYMISLPINKEENSREGLKIRYTGSTLNWQTPFEMLERNFIYFKYSTHNIHPSLEKTDGQYQRPFLKKIFNFVILIVYSDTDLVTSHSYKSPNHEYLQGISIFLLFLFIHWEFISVT